MSSIRYSIFRMMCCCGVLGGHFAQAADFNVSNSGSTAYIINTAVNPTLLLVRGQTYTFAITAASHPFWIKTNAVTGTSAAYTNGIVGNGTGSGTLTFSVPPVAPNSLTYICQFHPSMQGILNITNPPPTRARIENPRRSLTGDLLFDVAGTIGRLHFIEVSTNLGASWVTRSTNSTPSGSFSFSDPASSLTNNRIYRVRTQ